MEANDQAPSIKDQTNSKYEGQVLQTIGNLRFESFDFIASDLFDDRALVVGHSPLHSWSFLGHKRQRQGVFFFGGGGASGDEDGGLIGVIGIGSDDPNEALVGLGGVFDGGDRVGLADEGGEDVGDGLILLLEIADRLVAGDAVTFEIGPDDFDRELEGCAGEAALDIVGQATHRELEGLGIEAVRGFALQGIFDRFWSARRRCSRDCSSRSGGRGDEQFTAEEQVVGGAGRQDAVGDCLVVLDADAQVVEQVADHAGIAERELLPVGRRAEGDEVIFQGGGHLCQAIAQLLGKLVGLAFERGEHPQLEIESVVEVRADAGGLQVIAEERRQGLADLGPLGGEQGLAVVVEEELGEEDERKVALAVAGPLKAFDLWKNDRFGAFRSGDFLDVARLTQDERALLARGGRNVKGAVAAGIELLRAFTSGCWVAPFLEELLGCEGLVRRDDEAEPRKLSVVIVQGEQQAVDLVELETAGCFKGLALGGECRTEGGEDALAFLVGEQFGGAEMEEDLSFGRDAGEADRLAAGGGGPEGVAVVRYGRAWRGLIANPR